MLGRKFINREVRVRAEVEPRSDRAIAQRPLSTAQRPLGIARRPLGSPPGIAKSPPGIAKRRLGAGLVLALAASLVVGIGVPSASAQTASGPSVRIWVRKLASTNVQFGLSVTSSGTTRNVNLTDSYFLYPSNQVGTWYHSEWHVVGSSRVDVTGPGSVNAVARVRARKLASGNVEFGLELRGLGAVEKNNRQVWVPRARYFIYQATNANVVRYSSDFAIRSQAEPCLNGIVFEPANNLGLGDDCGTLLASKSVLTTSTEFLSSWNTGTPMFGTYTVNGWRGVHKQDEYDRVETLTFNRWPVRSGIPLDGSLPSYLGDLSGLKHLDLQENRLTGRIPVELANLTDLTRIKLSGNRLSGNIPTELSRLTKLRFLLLDDNMLSGRIPAELGDMINLRYLYLDENNLIGEIPPELGDLRNAPQIYLGQNNLNGAIPSELGKLSQGRLQSIALYNRTRGITDSPVSGDNLGLEGCIPKSLDGYNSVNQTITVFRGDLRFCAN